MGSALGPVAGKRSFSPARWQAPTGPCSILPGPGYRDPFLTLPQFQALAALGVREQVPPKLLSQ